MYNFRLSYLYDQTLIYSVRFLAAVCFAICLCPNSALSECNWAPHATPDGNNRYYVLKADSNYDPNDSGYTAPDANYFDTVLMGRNSAEVQARRDLAVSYFQNLLGLDFSSGDSLQGGKIILEHLMTDPRTNKRVHFSGGEMLPTDGWVVHEAEYRVTVVGAFAVFYGTWGTVDGSFVPNGATASHGEYLVEVRIPCRNPTSEQLSTVHMYYEYQGPALADFLDRQFYDLELSMPSEAGTAYGTKRYISETNGTLTYRERSIMKFPTS